MIFVYPYLRSDNDWDIIHSIGWIRKHFPSAHIVTVGHAIEQADECIPHLKRYHERGCDVTDKILTFCKVHPDTEFIYMNDDFFVTDGYNPQRTIHSGELIVNPAHPPHYQKACYNSYHFLKHNEFRTLNHECHQPVLFNARMLLDLFKSIQWKEHNHFIKSIYLNVYEVPSDEGKNLKLNDPKILLASQFISEHGSFSIGDGFKNPKGVEFITNMLTASPE